MNQVLKSTSSGRLSEKEARNNPLILDKAYHQIILALHATRFLLTKQVTTLIGLNQSSAHRRLTRLYVHRYVDRHPWPVPGNHRHTYTLDRLGIGYAAYAAGVPEKELRKRQTREVSPYFLQHYLDIADIYVALTVAVKTTDTSLTWRSEVEASDHYKLSSGRNRKLEPDAVFALTGPGIISTLVFLEVDRATESVRQWSQKLRDYNDYFLSGQVARRWPLPPRVLVLVTTPDLKRLERLRRFTAGGDRWQARMGGAQIPIGFTVHEALQPGRILGLPWAGLEEGESLRLVEAR
jgi:hypothetical protein